MENILRDIGRSYLISSVLPSILFILLGTLLFYDFIPPVLSQPFADQPLSINYGLILLIAFILFVAYTLYSIVDFTTKIFQGFYLPNRIKVLLKETHLKNRAKLLKKLDEYLAQSTTRISPGTLSAEQIANRSKLRIQCAKDVQKAEILYPAGENVMPTSLGNILQASVDYPMRRYGIDGSVFWEKLFVVFPDNFKNLLEDRNIQLNFLLNSSLLSFGTSLMVLILCLLYGIILIWNGLLLPWFIKYSSLNFSTITLDFIARGFERISLVGYLCLGILFLSFSYLFYRLGVSVAEDKSILIRVGYDFYRVDLLKSLNLCLPDDIGDQLNMWGFLNEYFAVGNRMGINYDSIAKYMVFPNKPVPPQ